MLAHSSPNSFLDKWRVLFPHDGWTNWGQEMLHDIGPSTGSGPDAIRPGLLEVGRVIALKQDWTRQDIQMTTVFKSHIYYGKP